VSVNDQFPLASALRQRLQESELELAAGEPCYLLEEVTPVTAELLRFWFQPEFCEMRPLNFHPGQRQAILAIIYAHEVLNSRGLLDLYQQVAPKALLRNGLLGELSADTSQHPKYAAKMATGTGKTWVLNALLIWQYLNHLEAPSDRRYTRNFLLVAPGLIVYDRLLDSFLGKEQDGERRFETSDLYNTRDLFIPDNYRTQVFGFVQSSVVTKADIGRKVTGGGQIAITNWHLLAGQEDPDFVDAIEAPGADIDAAAAVESFFPITPGTSAGNSLSVLDRRYARGGPLQELKDLPDLVVFNDEAHHIHEVKRAGEVTEVEWQRSLREIAATKGDRFTQIDFSATPYNQIGSGKKATRQFFPHIVVDFDLKTAMRSGLVKSLALDKRQEIAALPLEFRAERDAQGRTVGLSEGQRVMLRAGLTKLQRLEEGFTEVDPEKHPKLLIVCEDTTVTPFIEEFLRASGLGADEILVVDSNRKGEMSKDDWAATRERLFDVDRHKDPKVIVSVLMLREGFDVNNICVIVPLRSSTAPILLEQTIGRGLRLMWRGDEQIDALKRETRDRIRQRQEPNNYFDVLFIIEHPAFSDFYDELLQEGLASEVQEEDDDQKGPNPTGDIESIGLRDGYEQYDIAIPLIIRDAEEELRDPTVDPLSLGPCKFQLPWLLAQVGKGDVFISQDAQTGTQYGDYRVDGGVMTATGYNDYLSRMTRRIAEALGKGITKSARTYSQLSQYPALQVSLPALTGWIDIYIRSGLFGQEFEPLDDENWRVLLLDDVAHHIAGTFASALIAGEENQEIAEAEVRYRNISEVERITVRASSAVTVTKSVYTKLPVAPNAGGLERAFIEWADQDTQVEAFTKINEYKHNFLQQRYLKADGMPAMYSPDFLVRTADQLYVVETKAQRDLTDENVHRKRRAARAWCDRINALSPTLRENRSWSYVLLGEEAVKQWRSRNARITELLNYSRLSPAVGANMQERLL
jgi:type III restriction enzyme